jgi:tRNA (guanine37-N1)-methyltransferase
MKFDIISIFPEFFEGPLSCGMLRVARKREVIKVQVTNPRDFTTDGVVDDYQFGGGAGMVMKAEPLAKAIASVKTNDSLLINLTPQGRRLTQRLIHELAGKNSIVIICGRYKGIDARMRRLYDPLELSIGDYVLSGGEVGALVLIESITRLLPGVLGNRDSADTDSFQNDLFEAPLYTRPHSYKRLKAPKILRSGNHQLIARWRRKMAIEKTLYQRPDLISRAQFTKNDLELLLEVLDGKDSRN